MKDHNSTFVLNRLIKELRIPVTKQSIIDELQKHPYSSSLLAISDILDDWNIPNSAYRVTIKELQEAVIPLPFIACLTQEEFALIEEIDEKSVRIYNKRWRNQRLDIEEFRERYLGTILAVEKDDLSGERSYVTNRRKEIAKGLRIPFLICGTALLLLLFCRLDRSDFTAISWPVILIGILKTVGVIVSILLLLQSIDKNNPLIHKFCGNDDGKNCNAILTSPAAKITDELSWSEIGFFYFAGSLLTLAFSPSNNECMRLLGLLNLICLPYTFYSIYYQWRVARQWCIFCCSVQAVLWLEFFSFLPHWHWPPVDLSMSGTWPTLLTGMLLPIVLWVFIKPYLLASQQFELMKPELYRFKYNKDLFKKLAESEVKYQLLAETSTINIGSEEAEKIITVVSSPFCKACASAHQILDELIENRSDIKIQFIYVTRVGAKELDSKVLSHFLALKSHYTEDNLKKALNGWYSQKVKSYDLWQQHYPVTNFKIDTDTIEKHKAWCKMANVTGTPTMFIDGRRLPPFYRPEDIKYVI